MIFKILYTIIAVLSIHTLLAQNIDENNIEELLLEQLNDEIGDQNDISEISERLLQILRRPYDLNLVTEKELADLIFLSPKQISDIITQRETTGKFINILELQNIQSIPLEKARFLQNFVYVGTLNLKDQFSWDHTFSQTNQMIMVRYGRAIQTSKGFREQDSGKSRYFGDANRYAIRYRFNASDKVRFGLNAEKDAGEPFFAHKQKYGFDYYSAFLEFNNLSKIVRKVVVGDFMMQIGQGLITWNGLNFGKGAWIGSVARQGRGLSTYSSLNETNFQRGLATQLHFKNLIVSPFVAYNKLTATIHTLIDTNYVTSINYSGYHRTSSELENRKALGQFVYGLNVDYVANRLKVGATFMSTNFNIPFRKGKTLREQYNFEGKTLNQLGLHYNYNYHNLYIFGETTYNLGGAFATNNGLIASLHSKLSAFINYRNYSSNYHSFFARAISEGSSVSNEKGMYTGIIYSLTRKLEWTNYVDFFEFPWLRFRADAPSKGMDILSQLTYTKYKKSTLTFRYRYRLKEENITNPDRSINLLGQLNRQQTRIDYQHKYSSIWQFRSRVELSFYKKELATSSSGYMILQDVFYKPTLSKINLNTRIAYFNTQDYDARIYVYESDVLFAASFPMYYDHGLRFYLNTRYRISKKIDLWGRYAITKYFNRENIGSGLEETIGSNRSDVKLQIRWQW